MKNHLKSIAAPKTWVIAREQRKFTVRPKAGSHPLEDGMPLGLILRDKMQLADTMAQIKKILASKEVFVDGKRRKEYQFMVGLFDVISIPDLSKAVRIVLDSKGRITIAAIPQKESALKLCKVLGKTILPGSKLQVHLHDGKNIIFNTKGENLHVGDSIVIALPSLEVQQIIPLKENVTVFLTKGKHSGDLGQLKGIHGQEATYLLDGKQVQTAKEYLFVVGEKAPAMTISSKEKSKD